MVGLAQQLDVAEEDGRSLGQPAHTEGTAAAERAPAGTTAGVDTNAFSTSGLKIVSGVGRHQKTAEGLPPLFSGAKNVVDVGCGRGELLDLFHEHGIEARGIDSNDGWSRRVARGLTADQWTRSVSCSRSQTARWAEYRHPGGRTSGTVSDALSKRPSKLAPARRWRLRTANAACWTAFFDSTFATSHTSGRSI